ncbi:YfiR family protein [Rhodovastum atsumiense]|uniref:hypothetical protein n=1 Tax=Rhodovastum atsumiense TaxID=504468 RepID=UPI00139F2994|nr:hypothetical protein [Rhodovastum atsumiense]
MGTLPDRHAGRRRVLRLGVAWLSLATIAAAVEPGPDEVEVIARTLGFLIAAPGGTIDIGLVYPTGSEAGRTTAERIAATLGPRFVVDDLTLRPRPLTVEEAGRVAPPVLLLTQAALPQAGILAASLAGKRVLTASTDPGSVERQQVVLAVRAHPRIEIFVSHAAARMAGLQFSTAFRMFVQER